MEVSAACKLRRAVCAGDEAAVRRLLAESPQPAALASAADELGITALIEAVRWGRSGSPAHVAVVRLLLAVAPGAAMARTHGEDVPLHYAVCTRPRAGHAAPMVQVLLQAAPEAALVQNINGDTPAHNAAAFQDAAALSLLLHAAPAAARMRNMHGAIPLEAVFEHTFAEADLAADGEVKRALGRLLLAVPGQSCQALLQALARSGPQARPLMSELVELQPLTPADWELVLAPCAELAQALPAVLRRSTAEATCLVARLAGASRQRLRTAALSMHRAQRQLGLHLPSPLLWQILACCAS